MSQIMMAQTMRARVAGSALIALPLVFGGLGASAAPQALALLSTDRPVDLRCAEGVCTAELATLCLQPDRRVPQRGRAYTLAPTQSLTLRGVRADGKPVAVRISQGLRITAARTHVAVRLELDEKLVAALGISTPQIRVGQAVTAIPAPASGDAKPQSQFQIDRAVHHGRLVADRLVDRNSKRMPSVRLMNAMINALPEDGSEAIADRNLRWRDMLASAKDRNVPEQAREYAAFNYKLCSFKLESGIVTTMKQCLRGLSDDTLEYLNADLEPALKTGS